MYPVADTAKADRSKNAGYIFVIMMQLPAIQYSKNTKLKLSVIKAN